MTKPIINSVAKQMAPKEKRGKPVNSTNKQAKKNWAVFGFYDVCGLFISCG